MEEARGLAASGVKELIVIAQDITRYGLDRKDGSTLAKLLDRLCELDFHWIRLHYLYPEAVTDELIETIARQPKILHYLDIPIQHCNDAILKAMRRRNTRAEIEALFAKLRKAMPDVVLRTSLICGLPGEGRRSLRSCATSCGSSASSGPASSSSPLRRGPWPPPWRAKWTRTPPPGGWNWWWISNPGSWTSTMRSGWAP